MKWSPRFAVALVLVALASAAFAIVFRGTLNATVVAVGGVANIVQAMERADWWWRLVLPAVGATAAGLIALTLRDRSGGNVGEVMDAVATGRAKLSLPSTLLKSAASWVAIAGGGSLGREGPLIAFGGATGQTAAYWIQLSDAERRVLIAAGTAAGFTAAYNTPLAAMAFVLEVVTGIVVVETVVPALISVVISTALTRAIIGAGPIYGRHEFAITRPGELAAFAAVGLVAALVAFGFTRLVMASERAFRRPWLAPPWRQALGGLGAGAIICVLPQVAGNGYEPLSVILNSGSTLQIVAFVLVAKCFATAFSVGSGSPGGVFTPTLLVGGCTGYLVGAGLAALGFDVIPAGGYALVGMAAAIAAATHAPLMGAILAFELSGDYELVLPLVLATAIATALAKRLRRDSIYTAELKAREASPASV